jgi:K+-transporting ATPase ATPase C chain
MRQLFQSVKAYVVFMVLLGLVYPLGITLVAQVLMPYNANGSLIVKNSKVVGSTLIAQGFSKPEYFQSRLSANAYDATNSGGTNLGPSSKKLIDGTEVMVKQIRDANGLAPNAKVPADMALTSASGLDPHISYDNALIQSKRVAQLRGITLRDIKKLIDKNTDSDFAGLWGCSGVNVLKLNLALDEYKK